MEPQTGALKPDDLVRHAGFVRRLAGRLLADDALADDLAQDALVVALERPPRRTDNVRGWLRRVVSSLAWKWTRTQSRRRRRERAAARPEAVLAADPVARLEIEGQLVEAVLELAEPYRSAIVLRFLDGMATVEIARRQGVPRKTVETRLRRALVQLRGRLDSLHAGDRRAWGLALLPLLGRMRIRRAAPVLGAAEVAAMASKATIAITGFLCGVGATALYTRLGEAPPERSPRRERAPRRTVTAAPVTTAADEVGGEATASRQAHTSAAEYLRRINEAPTPDWALKVAREITKLPAAQGRDIVRTIYAEIVDPSKREQVLRAFTERQGHEFSLDVLDLGARDREPQVQGSAFGWLKQFAFRDFQEDPDAYRTWREKYAGLPLGEVLRLNARGLFDRLRGLDGPALARELRFMGGPPNKLVGRCVGVALPSVLKGAGTLEAVERWISPPMPSEEEEPEQFRCQQTIRRAAWAWLEAAEPDEEFLRRVVAPIVRNAAQRRLEDLVFAVIAVGKAKQEWAFETLLEALRTTPPSSLRFNLAMGLAESGGQRAIPYMIAAIVAADDTEWTAYGLGHFGLRTLTGVRWDKSHDGAWWLAWWDRNKDRLPPEVRAIDPTSLVAEFRR
jgi:RNA polymerase sigma-70 factor (ECF subfamily)